MGNTTMIGSRAAGEDVPLQFLYDIKAKKVLFSSQSPDSFFPASPDFNNRFPFYLSARENDLVALQHDWDECLLLKDREKSDFFFASDFPGPAVCSFHFSITGVGTFDKITGNLLLFTVQKLAETNGTEKELLLEEAYRKECAEFINMAAHELDAPIRKISVLIDRLGAKGGVAVTESDYFIRVMSCLQDTRSLIAALTTLADCSYEKSSRKSCDTAALIKKIAGDFPALQEENVLQLTNLPVVMADPGQLALLFRNLLENAVRFARKDRPLRIHVTGEAIDTAGNSGGGRGYKFIVSDNGIGFNQQYARQIFKPFVRLHGKSAYPGNGIGLAICSSVAANHLGVVYAESGENEGARFTFILPQSHN